jgi:cell division protein YceG involved in septum cleavage
MKPRLILFLFLQLAFFFSLQTIAQAQNPPAGDKTPAVKTSQANRLRIEVTGGEKDTPVENASVYLKYVEERKIFKDKKYELNVKTNREGVAHIPEAPTGKVLIQIVAEGWKLYGKWYEITDPKQVIKIKLEKPPKWY